ncbi:hypothetical protein NP493_1963g00001 [Ridgeia piscesae]|uniref:Uncharacterized protein n=1 Tax=Ridgeia piscesae TaxID=27915 RepID=A0AAD9JNL0_RIDPI|nr:hypothetical protein NP493_1963g00001 [Ridgeia piscesae]
MSVSQHTYMDIGSTS